MYHDFLPKSSNVGTLKNQGEFCAQSFEINPNDQIFLPDQSANLEKHRK